MILRYLFWNLWSRSAPKLDAISPDWLWLHTCIIFPHSCVIQLDQRVAWINATLYWLTLPARFLVERCVPRKNMRWIKVTPRIQHLPQSVCVSELAVFTSQPRMLSIVIIPGVSRSTTYRLSLHLSKLYGSWLSVNTELWNVPRSPARETANSRGRSVSSRGRNIIHVRSSTGCFRVRSRTRMFLSRFVPEKFTS